MALGGGWAFRKWLGHEGGTLIIGISAFIKEALESSPAPSAIWAYSEKAMYEEAGAHRTQNLPGPWS